jgi:gliding motility-associated-like protein
MKIFFLSISFWMCTEWSMAQNPDAAYPISGNPYPSYVFGISGGSDTINYKNTILTITWTLGEIALSEQRSDIIVISEGMHQSWPDLFFIPSQEVPDISMVITPNGDGQNDFFVPVDNIEARFPDNEIFIFNRWGVLVFQDKPYTNNWNGTNFNGQDLAQGTYYYLLRLKNRANSQMKGSITIRR